MYSVVITAAGSGRRANLGYNKMLYKIDRQTVLEKVVDRFINNEQFDEIVVTASETDLDTYRLLLADYDVKIVVGGAERMDSVAKGVQACTSERVFVHDGARIFIDDELIDRLANYRFAYDGLALAMPVIDTTLKVIDGRIEAVLDRFELYNMQTPQVVDKEKYLRCYKQSVADDLTFTDEMSMLTYYGHECRIVEGATYNRKLTLAEDFEV